MDSGGIPTKFPVIWGTNASGANLIAVPTTTANPNIPSLSLGWPPNNLTSLGAGGTPPDGRYDNGLNKQITAWLQWQNAGAPVSYDGTFSAAIGGYPLGSMLLAAAGGFFWVSSVENNTTDPDTGGAGWVRLNRLVLATNLNVYVSTTGSDSNNGLTSGAPWATLQHAWNVIQQFYDLNGFTATINIADGTYNAGLSAAGPIIGGIGAGSVIFSGNAVTPSNVKVTVSGGNPFLAVQGAQISVQNLQVSGQFGINAQSGAQLYYQNVVFAACTGAHISSQQGALVFSNGAYSIASSSPSHLRTASGGFIQTSVLVTLSGSPVFSGGFANSTTGGIIESQGTTFSGATGASSLIYSATLNGVIDTQSGNPNFFPGNVSGTIATGGQYA